MTITTKKKPLAKKKKVSHPINHIDGILESLSKSGIILHIDTHLANLRSDGMQVYLTVSRTNSCCGTGEIRDINIGRSVSKDSINLIFDAILLKNKELRSTKKDYSYGSFVLWDILEEWEYPDDWDPDDSDETDGYYIEGKKYLKYLVDRPDVTYHDFVNPKTRNLIRCITFKVEE